jgi:hypothetical protein
MAVLILFALIREAKELSVDILDSKDETTCVTVILERQDSHLPILASCTPSIRFNERAVKP